MCLTYMFNCQVCGRSLRHYREWPRFCEKDYCIKFRDIKYWTLSIPCNEQCKKEECGVVYRPVKITCTICYNLKVREKFAAIYAQKAAEQEAREKEIQERGPPIRDGFETDDRK